MGIKSVGKYGTRPPCAVPADDLGELQRKETGSHPWNCFPGDKLTLRSRCDTQYSGVSVASSKKERFIASYSAFFLSERRIILLSLKFHFLKALYKFRRLKTVRFQMKVVLRVFRGCTGKSTFFNPRNARSAEFFHPNITICTSLL